MPCFTVTCPSWITAVEGDAARAGQGGSGDGGNGMRRRLFNCSETGELWN